MDMWNLLTTFMADPTVQSFFVSCGASASWDAIKIVLKKAERDNSFALQVYQVIKETFESFYLKYGLEFEEDIVMTSFLETINEIGDFKSSDITKKMICDTMGLDVDNFDLEEWIKIFIVKCSNPKYQWVYNKLSLSFIKHPEKSKQKAWMHKYMKDNFCKIQCNLVDELSPIFKDISTQLQQVCWYDTRVLIWEILFNAQGHGKAKECILHINENSITILDDGIQFNPITMQEQFSQQGGSLAIKKFMHDYPEVSLKSEYFKNRNQFTIDFGNSVFNINDMSEIVIPRLYNSFGQYQLKHPKGRFRYYYIDIDEIPRDHDELFVTFSDACMLFDKLKANIVPFSAYDKIFIYFSDLTRFDYREVFNMMYMVLKRDIYASGIKIVLLSDTHIFCQEYT